MTALTKSLSGTGLMSAHQGLSPTIEGVPPSYTIMGRDASRMNYEALNVMDMGMAHKGDLRSIPGLDCI
jgi:hypothetical protein